MHNDDGEAFSESFVNIKIKIKLIINKSKESKQVFDRRPIQIGETILSSSIINIFTLTLIFKLK
jgi:hypothetical protein